MYCVLELLFVLYNFLVLLLIGTNQLLSAFKFCISKVLYSRLLKLLARDPYKTLEGYYLRRKGLESFLIN